MEAIRKTLSGEEVQEAISSSNLDPSSTKCWRCFDVGVVLTDGCAKNCICLRRAQNRTRLAIVPPIFNNPKLARLKPRDDLHRRQAGVIAFVKTHPEDSYLFTGRNGTGKSHIAWAIYRHALASRRPTIACTVRDLLADFRRVEIGVPDGATLRSPRITAGQLRKPGKPYLLFLDEFEKARPSEFASEQLFNLLDAVKSFNHQLVITSNLSASRLRDHWGRIDEIWGNSILTRLEHCHQVEMF